MLIPFWAGAGFQNVVGQVYSQLESLHDLIIVWLVVIIVVVFFVGFGVCFGAKGSLLIDSEVLEKTWTLIPMVILLTIAFPSIHLLCLQDAICQKFRSRLKVVSNQWNWQREMEEPVDHLLDPDGADNLGSYESPVGLLGLGVVRVLVTRTDVLHSLGLPRLGVKLDSAPGRLNATSVDIIVPGLHQGSCFELCGRGHRAIPIYFLAT